MKAVKCYLLIGLFLIFALAQCAFAHESNGTVFKMKCSCCDKCKCVRTCKCGGKCDCCYRCNCADKCMCLGECTCCKKCKCEYVCSCKGKCNCCSNCYCAKRRVCENEAMGAGKNAYILSGKVEKDGPSYVLTTAKGSRISVTASSRTEFHPYWIKPENLPKVLVKFSVKSDGSIQADQIYDAKSAYIGKAPSGGKTVGILVKKEVKEK